MSVEAISKWFYRENKNSDEKVINDCAGYIFLYEDVCKNRGITKWILNNIREDKYYDLLNGIIKSKYLNDNLLFEIEKKIIKYCLENNFSGNKCGSKKFRRVEKSVLDAFFSFLEKNNLQNNVEVDLNEDTVNKIMKEIINSNLDYIFKNEEICTNKYLIKFIISSVEKDKYDLLVNNMFKCKCLDNSIASLLLENMQEADFSKIYTDGKTILTKVIETGFLDITLVKKILEKRVDINIQDEHGMTALHYACAGETKNLEILEKYISELLKNGARVDIKDKEGRTPLNCVDWREYELGILNWSLDASISEVADDEFKSLNMVKFLEEKRKKIIKCLIESGAKEEEIRDDIKKLSQDKKLVNIKKYVKALIREPFVRIFLSLLTCIKSQRLRRYCAGSWLIIDTVDIKDRYRNTRRRGEKINYGDLTKELFFDIVFFGISLLSKINKLMKKIYIIGIFVFVGTAGYKVYSIFNMDKSKEKVINLYNDTVIKDNKSISKSTERQLNLKFVKGKEDNIKLNDERSMVNNTVKLKLTQEYREDTNRQNKIEKSREI